MASESEIMSRAYDNAVLVPWQSNRTGVFVNGHLVSDAMLYRQQDKPVFDPSVFPLEWDSLGIEAIYAGFAMTHFGHFLLEGLARLWLAKRRPDLPLVWCLPQAYLPYQKEVLQILGIGNEAIFIKRPVQVRRLHIPQPGLVIKSFFRPAHAVFLGVWPARKPLSGKRVWLSRTALGEDFGGVVNEPEVEEHLARQGWTIFHPEQHAFSAQIEMLADAERIAGSSGSAFHTLILLESIPGRVDVISRGLGISENLRLIADTKGIHQRDHTPSITLVQEGDTLVKNRYKWKRPDEVLAALA